jgi:L-ascorbate metabolism protein UlaG (beta-lactamase superfamily)
MDITYVGHSCFRLRGKEGLVITDPFSSSVGFPMPKLSADVVTVSHDHEDHNQHHLVKGTTSREKPFIITQPGEYEVQGISVYGYPTYHDGKQGTDRGTNVMYSIFLDDVHILHLGDLGHLLDEKLIQGIPDVDVLLVPVGGVYTIDPTQALEVISLLEPAYVVPMHYKTEAHNQATYGEMFTVDDFIQKSGKQAKTMEKLTLSGPKSGEESETQLIVLEGKVAV